MNKMPILFIFSFVLLAVWSVIADLAPATQPTPTPELVGGSKEPTYFAEIAPDGTVLRVIVADRAFINSGVVGDPENWVQTWKGGGGRKNYAGAGAKYDRKLDAFIPPKLKEDAVLDNVTLRWIYE